MAGKPGRSGRKSNFTPELGEKICEEVASGKMLKAVLRQSGMPSWTAVWKWTTQHPEFGRDMAQARISGAWALVDDAFEIAAKTPKDNAAASQQREQLKLHCWMVSKMVPATFGDKVSVDMNVKGDMRLAETRADAVLLADARLARLQEVDALRRAVSKLPDGPAREEIYRLHPESRPYVPAIESTARRIPNTNQEANP